MLAIALAKSLLGVRPPGRDACDKEFCHVFCSEGSDNLCGITFRDIRMRKVEGEAYDNLVFGGGPDPFLDQSRIEHAMFMSTSYFD